MSTSLPADVVLDFSQMHVSFLAADFSSLAHTWLLFVSFLLLKEVVSDSDEIAMI